METIEEIYARAQHHLTPSQRFQLATRLLNALPPKSFVDFSEEWSEEDYRDFTTAGNDLIASRLEDEESA